MRLLEESLKACFTSFVGYVTDNYKNRTYRTQGFGNIIDWWSHWQQRAEEQTGRWIKWQVQKQGMGPTPATKKNIMRYIKETEAPSIQIYTCKKVESHLWPYQPSWHTQVKPNPLALLTHCPLFSQGGRFKCLRASPQLSMDSPKAAASGIRPGLVITYLSRRPPLVSFLPSTLVHLFDDERVPGQT